MSEQKTRTLNEVWEDAYEAYLIARQTGRSSLLNKQYDWTIDEHYAAALGVDHYFRGLKPISFRALLDATEEACRGMDDESPLGPTPPDPGEIGKSQPARIVEDSHQSEVGRLVDYLEQHFPGEPGSQRPPEGETAVDVALRLLEELAEARKRAAETVLLVRNAVQEEREACARHVRCWGTLRLADEILKGEHRTL